MKYKKKIDDIYREGLQNAETPPPADSWEIISSRLPEKREKVLPLWMKWSGVAAVLVLMLMVFNFTIFDTPLPQPIVNEKENSEEHIISPASEITPEAESQIADTETQEPQDNENFSGSSSSEKFASEASTSEAVGVPHRNSNSGFSPSEVSRPEVSTIAENTVTRNASEDKVMPEAKEPSKAPTTKAIAEAAEAPKKTFEAATLKEDLSEEITKEEATFAETEPEALPSKNENFLKRFRISTTAGAVYFDVGNSNTVDEQFADHAGGSEVSMAYGVNIAYQVSDKIKIRSGVNKVNFNYNTRQVDYSEAMSSRAVKTDPAGMGILLSAQGDLDQEFGFIEVPMEVEFTLIDKKIGLNLIGGASTLFLEENKLVMTTPGFTTDFGEAQNLNQLSFSANLGIGVHYKFAPKIRLNLEPMFKYQLNTFNHSDSHYFGIYSGLSYQF